MGNSLVEAIHGISLYDYAAISARLAAGNPKVEILNAMGIELDIYEEAAKLWVERMQEDKSDLVSKEFGQYFSKVNEHPKLGTPKFNISEVGIANLEKLKTDPYFFEELCGAKKAAYEYGLDGAHWIFDNYGITLVDFQLVENQWNQTIDKREVHFSKFQVDKQVEYAKKFAAKQDKFY